MNKILEKLSRFFGEFEFAVLDTDKGQRWVVPTKPESIHYLRRENAQGKHILIKPAPALEPQFMLVDDLDMVRIERDHKTGRSWKPGRMAVETSPDNFQVWIHSGRDLSLDEKRYWLKQLGSDLGADPNGRWGRCPGFRNRKEKHRDQDGGYPLARLVWVDWRQRVQIPAVDLPGREESFDPIKSASANKVLRPGDIFRSDYDRGDESATDFAFALALMWRGFGDEEVFDRIRAGREGWTNHEGERRIQSYLLRTVKRAREKFESQKVVRRVQEPVAFPANAAR
jgi:hypothetical protein